MQVNSNSKCKRNMYYYKKCEICGLRAGRQLDQKRTFMARFPLKEDLCKKWVKVVGKEDLAYVPIEKLHTLKYVCGNHFRPKKDFKKRGTQLKRAAVPSLEINAEPLKDEILVDFPLHVMSAGKTKKQVDKLENKSSENFAEDSMTKRTELKKKAVSSLQMTADPLQDEILMELPHIPADNAISNQTLSLSSHIGLVVAENDYCRINVGTSKLIVNRRKRPYSPKPSTSIVESATVGPDDLKTEAPTWIMGTATVVTDDSKTEAPTWIMEIATVVTDESKTEDPTWTMETATAGTYDSKSEAPTWIMETATAVTDDSETEDPTWIMETATVVTDESKTEDPTWTMETATAVTDDSETEDPTWTMETATVRTHNWSTVKPCSPKSSARTVSVSRMSPRNTKLLNTLQKSQVQVKNLQKRLCQIEEKSSPVKSLIASTAKNQNRKPKGKSWTNLNKIVALAIIYKNSPKTYVRYSSQLLLKPGVLQNMKMEPGIDPSIMAHLKKKAENLTDQEKTCVMLFDEMALNKRLIYNTATDEVDGFEDLGSEGTRSEKIANRALVLMIQGIHKKIKQPVAYYFVNGTISTEKLVVIIKTAIRAVTEAGYKVLATVCDQKPTNVGAMNSLKDFSGKSVDSNYYLVDNEKVFVIYDVPHLFKTIRNNFYDAGELVMNNNKAKWAHLVKLEEENRSTLHLMKIRKAHVNLKYRTRMRVKPAAQILSNTVAAILKLQAESVKNKENSEEILQTAHVVEDLDRLFDCTNGPASRKETKKNKRENVSKRSFHQEYWTECIRKLRTLHILKSDSKLRLRNDRCVNGFIMTISSLQDIWKYVESKNFKFLNLRQCNQDALENLFGMIRQHSPTNKKPTCHQFTSGLKLSILTRLSTPINKASNCEQDKNEILFDFHDIVFANTDGRNEKCDEYNFESEMEEIDVMFKGFTKQPSVYVSGYIAKVLLKDVDCQNCINAIKVVNPKPNSVYNYKALTEWWADKASLTYPTLQLCEAIDNATKIFELEVKPRIYITDVSKHAITFMMAATNVSWMCIEHQDTMTDNLLRRLSFLLIRKECQRQNAKFATL